MKIRITVILTTIAFFLSGCIVQSLHPFFTESTRVKVPSKIKGVWVQDESASQEKPAEIIASWLLDETEVTIYDDKGVGTYLKVNYFKVGDTLFADITVDQNDYTKFDNLMYDHLIPVHSVVKVEFTEDKLHITSLNHSWMEHQLKNGKISLQSTPYPEDLKEYYRLYTASPENWITFLKKYKNDKVAFPDERRYKLRRPR